MAAVATNTFAGDLFSASTTVSGVPIGAAFPGRVVVIACVATGNGIDPITINGVVADVVDGTNILWAAAIISTGTTATIVVPGSNNTEVFGAWSLTGYPSTVNQANIFAGDSGAGLPIDVLDDQCILGWVVGVVDPPGTIGTFTAILTNNGSAFDTNAGSIFGGSKPGRVGSVNIGLGGGGTLTVTVGGFTTLWDLALVVYGGGGIPPASDSLMGQIWMT